MAIFDTLRLLKGLLARFSPERASVADNPEKRVNGQINGICNLEGLVSHHTTTVLYNSCFA